MKEGHALIGRHRFFRIAGLTRRRAKKRVKRLNSSSSTIDSMSEKGAEEQNALAELRRRLTVNVTTAAALSVALQEAVSAAACLRCASIFKYSSLSFDKPVKIICVEHASSRFSRSELAAAEGTAEV